MSSLFVDAVKVLENELNVNLERNLAYPETMMMDIHTAITNHKGYKLEECVVNKVNGGVGVESVEDLDHLLDEYAERKIESWVEQNLCASTKDIGLLSDAVINRIVDLTLTSVCVKLRNNKKPKTSKRVEDLCRDEIVQSIVLEICERNSQSDENSVIT